MLEQDTNTVIMIIYNAGIYVCIYMCVLLYTKVIFLLNHYFYIFA